MRARLACLVAALLVASISRAARAAEPDEVELFVAAPPSSDCVTADDLRAQVEDRVGPVLSTHPATTESANRKIEVRIVPRSRAFSATIRAVDAQGRVLGERSLSSEGPDCRQLERPLVLVISTLIGITREEPALPAGKAPDRDERKPVRSVSTDDPSADTAVSEAVPAAPSAPAEPFRFGLALTGGAETAFLPGFAPLGSLKFLARRGSVEFRAGVGAAPWGVRDLGGSAEARFRALFGDADVCGLTSATTASELAFCAGVRAGALQGKSSGLYENANTVRPFVQVTLRTSFRAALSRQHSLVFELGGAVPLLPQTYTFVEADGVVHRIHTVELGVFAEAGWLWRFSS